MIQIPLKLEVKHIVCEFDDGLYYLWFGYSHFASYKNKPSILDIIKFRKSVLG